MSQYMWLPATKRASRPKVSASTKAILKKQADQWVENQLKPKHVQPPPEGHDFNYLVDIFTKWHGSFFYFCGTYSIAQAPGLLAHLLSKNLPEWLTSAITPKQP